MRDFVLLYVKRSKLFVCSFFRILSRRSFLVLSRINIEYVTLDNLARVLGRLICNTLLLHYIHIISAQKKRHPTNTSS